MIKAIEALFNPANDNPAKINKLIIITTSPTIKIVFLPNLDNMNPEMKGATNNAPPTPQDI